MTTRFEVHNAAGDILCMYKATPEATLPTVGFIGAAAVELLLGGTCAALRYISRDAAECSRALYVGRNLEGQLGAVVAVEVSEDVPVVSRLVNGDGW